MLIDTHAHLNLEPLLSDVGSIIDRARGEGVGMIINVGIDLPTTEIALDLADRFPACRATAGIHPHEAGKAGDAELSRLRELLETGRFVAVGEAGLDYFRDRSPRDAQGPLFRAQIEMAIDLDLPIIVHMRDALDDGITLLEEYGGRGLRGVMHCFAGTTGHATRCLDLGLHVSFAGPLTFKNAHDVRKVAVTVPLERTLLETDSPFLAPQPIRGQTNEPAAVRFVAEKQAEIRDMTVDEVIAQTTKNARELFRLGTTT